jgi:hypothetical protein
MPNTKRTPKGHPGQERVNGCLVQSKLAPKNAREYVYSCNTFITASRCNCNNYSSHNFHMVTKKQETRLHKGKENGETLTVVQRGTMAKMVYYDSSAIRRPAAPPSHVTMSISRPTTNGGTRRHFRTDVFAATITRVTMMVLRRSNILRRGDSINAVLSSAQRREIGPTTI